jgi:hypothetical protein
MIINFKISYEIGDRIKMKPTKYNKGCYYLNKVYKIEKFSKSKSSAYYNFKITNNRCKCYQCSHRIHGINSVGITDIEIYQTKKEFDRIFKLNKLLKI